MSEQIQAICAALEFIEGHLGEPITVADIAASAGYSLYHFIRTFNQTTQHTPYDYLMRRRLSDAAFELLESDRRVIDIALDFQFKNHETFSRAFGRIFGMSPTRWREQEFMDSRLLMPALSRDYLIYLNAPNHKPPRLVRLDEIILAGLMTSETGDPETIPSLWRNLREALLGLPLKSRPRDFWGLRIHPQIPGGTSFYLAAIKIPSLESVPATFVTKILPAGEYITHTYLNDPSTLEFSLQYLYHTFLPKSGLFLLHPWEIKHCKDQGEVFVPVQTKETENRSAKFKKGES